METSVREVTSQIRLETWRKNIAECNASGLTIRNWCSENGHTEASYYYWLKKLRKKVIEKTLQSPTDMEPIVPMLQTFKDKENSLSENHHSFKKEEISMTITTSTMKIDFKSNTSTELALSVIEVLKNA